MTTMQNMSCMMCNSASATFADAATSCAYTVGMQSASTSMIMMGAMIMASIIIFSGLIISLILGSLRLTTLLALVLLGILGIIKMENTTRPEAKTLEIL